MTTIKDIRFMDVDEILNFAKLGTLSVNEKTEETIEYLLAFVKSVDLTESDEEAVKRTIELMGLQHRAVETCENAIDLALKESADE